MQRCRGRENAKKGKLSVFCGLGTRLPQALVGCFARDGFINADEIRDAVISATRGDLADRCTAAAE